MGPDGRLLGVVHRDISPSNVMISFRGDVKVGDFGIALVEHESRTQAGVLKGKYGYMSPEQVAGVKVDHRSDIFSAGIVLTEMLLGRRLFLGRNDFETLDKVLNVRLDVLEKNSEALPPEVVAISERALHQEPHHRYQSAREFHDAIMELLYAQGKRITNETLAAFMAQHVVPHLKRPSLAELSTSGLFPKSPVRAPLAAGKGAPGADASGGEDRPGTDSEAKGMPDITPSPSSAPPSNGEGKAASALGLGQAVDPPPGQAGSTPLAPQEPALDPQEILKNQGEGSSDQLDSGELDLDSDPGNEADSDGS